MQDIKELQKILYEKAAQENSLDAGILKLAWVVYKRTYVEAFIAGFKAGQSGNINEWMTILKEWPEDVTESQNEEMLSLNKQGTFTLADLESEKFKLLIRDLTASVGQVLTLSPLQASDSKPSTNEDLGGLPFSPAPVDQAPPIVESAPSPGSRETLNPLSLKAGGVYETTHHETQTKVRIAVHSHQTLGDYQVGTLIKPSPQRKEAPYPQHFRADLR